MLAFCCVGSRVIRPWRLATIGAFLAAIAMVQPAAAETRTYAMTMFWHGIDSKPNDCPQGMNPKIAEQYKLNLARLGYQKPEIDKMMELYAGEGGGGRGWEADTVGQLMFNRGRIDGKPVNAFIYPLSTIDPHLKTMDSKYAFGFDLDGRGATPGSFEDPETHEKGVDHQLSRVLGCLEAMRGELRKGSAFYLFQWMALKDTAPAWTFTISGDNLSKDGPVTIKIGRALEPAKFNGDGSGRTSMTYREDPDPRLKGNVYKGQIKDGVVTITEPGNYVNVQDILLFPTFSMKNFHIRLKLAPDGSMDGIIGGYQPVEEVYFSLTDNHLGAEMTYGFDFPGVYYSMRHLADGDPDPKTGQNRAISATYYVQGIQGYLAPAERAVTAAPGS